MQYATYVNALPLILAHMGESPWGVATFNKRTRSEAVGTLVLTNTSQ
jgi:hypothetical protein